MFFHIIIENIITYVTKMAIMWPLTNKRKDKIWTLELDFMIRCLQLPYDNKMINI